MNNDQSATIGLILGAALVSSGLTLLALGRAAAGIALCVGGVVLACALWWVGRSGRSRGAGSPTKRTTAAGVGGGVGQGGRSDKNGEQTGGFARAQYTPPTLPEAPPSGAPHEPFVAEHTVAQDFEPDYKAHAVPGLGAIYKELHTPGVYGFVLVVAGPDRGRGLAVTEGEAIAIGRGAHNHLALRDPGASATHCQFCYRDGALWVEDTASKNGTFLNNERITRARVGNCDVVAIGATRLLVVTL